MIQHGLKAMMKTRFRHILMLQYLLRHKTILTDYNLKEAYKIMKKGSNYYLDDNK